MQFMRDHLFHWGWNVLSTVPPQNNQSSLSSATEETVLPPGAELFAIIQTQSMP